MNNYEQQHLYHTDIPVGEILRRSRLEFGQSLADVSEVIRIKSAQLDAIEKGEFHKLPGKVYAIGFIRTYSEYLGLDGDKMVELFRVQFRVGKERPELHFPTPASESLNPGVYIVVFSIMLLIGLGVWWGYSSTNSEKQNNSIPEVPEKFSEAFDTDENTIPEISTEDEANNFDEYNQTVIQSSDETENSPYPENYENTTTPPETNKPEHSILLKVTDESWVEINDKNGEIIISRTLQPGKEYFVPKHYEGLMLTTGNAGGIILNIDGQDYPALGKQSEIKRNIPLNSDILKKMLEKKPEM